MSMPAIVLVVAVLAALTARRSLGGGLLGRLRALLPAWRFFDAIEPTPRLCVRVIRPGDSPGRWIDVMPKPKGGFFLASDRNLVLAMYALVERLVSSDEDAPDAPGIAVTYAQITELARERARLELGDSGLFQWCITDHQGARLERARSEFLPI